MTGLTAWVVVGVASVAGIETPKYEVLSKHDGYEIRQYAPQIVAEVTVEGDFKESMNSGFRKLADYIFGNNTKASAGERKDSEKIEMTAPVLERDAGPEKIKMTAPVIERDQQAGTRVVSFVMPEKYSLDTLPKPNNSDVSIVQVPAIRYAVIQFSGRVQEDKAEEMKQLLLDLMKRDNLETEGKPLLAQYNPPWTPPPMRRNEVMVALK